MEETNSIDSEVLKASATPLNIGPQADRLTITQRVHHEHLGDPPQSIESIFSRALEVSDECYVTRRMKSSTTWKPLDLGFYAECPQDIGMICIQNLTGNSLTVNPTEDEKKELDNSVVEVAFSSSDPEDFIEVWPGMMAPFCFSDPKRVRVRCRNESTRFMVFVIPR